MNNTTNAAVKTLINAAAGFLAPVILSFFDHPTGGVLSALQHNPIYAAAWGATSYFFHNLYDTYNPPTANNSANATQTK